MRDIEGAETPAQLRHLNWIFFREGDNFEAALAKFLAALHTDFEWVQAHRKLQVKALEWERRQREKSFLLHGEELHQAEFQLNAHATKEPHPTALQQEYISTSRKAADRQRRNTTSLVAIVIVALAALAVFGFVQAGGARTAQAAVEVNLYAAQTAQVDAQQRQRQADDNAATAEANANAAATAQAKALASANIAATAQAVAENAQAETEKALQRVQAVAGFRAEALASLSQKAGERSSSFAALLAAEAYKTAANSATIARLFELLQTDLMANQFEARNGVYVVAFSPQGDQLVAGYNNGREALKLWSVTTPGGTGVLMPEHQNAVYGAAFSPDGQILASADFDGRVIIWEVASRQPRGNPIDSGGKKLFSLAFNPTNPDMFVTGGEAGIITIWNAATGRIVNELPGHNDTINSLAFSPDGK